MLPRDSSKRAYLSFMLFNFAFFMMDTTSSYFTIYLNEIGFSKSMIGIISGTAAAVALLAQPALGILADSSKSKNRLLQCLILVTAILYPLILVNNSFIFVLVVYTVYYCFRRAQPSLNTSMSVEYAETAHKDYGPIRTMGALGYCLVMFLVGQIAGIPGKGTQLTFFTYTIFCVVNILLIFLLPPIQGHNRVQYGCRRLPASAVLKSRPILLLIVYMMFYALAQGLYFSYFSIYFTNDLGGSNELYGTMLSVGAFCEIPFLFIADRLSRKVGAKKILLILGMLSGTRWLLTYLISTPQGQFGVQMLNCINMLNSVTVSITLSRLVAPQFKTTVQTLLVTFESVVSIIISSFLGGFFADLVGIRPMFLIAAIVCYAAAIVFPGLLIHQRDLEHQSLTVENTSGY